MIRFSCATCGEKLSAPDGAAGKRGKCNKCGASNTVPQAVAEPSPRPASQATPPLIKPERAVARPAPLRPQVMPPELPPAPPPPAPAPAQFIQVVAPPSQVSVSQQVVVHAPQTNGLGTAGFVCSLLGFLTCGLLSPIGLFFSLLAFYKPPRGMAFAGFVLGMIGSAGLALFGFTFILGLTGARNAAIEMDRAVQQAQQEQAQREAAEGARQDVEEFPGSIQPAAGQ